MQEQGGEKCKTVVEIKGSLLDYSFQKSHEKDIKMVVTQMLMHVKVTSSRSVLNEMLFFSCSKSPG